MDIFASLSDDGRFVVGVVAGEQGAPQVLTLSDGGELVWTGGMDALAVEGASALVRDGRVGRPHRRRDRRRALEHRSARRRGGRASLVGRPSWPAAKRWWPTT